MSSVLGQRPWRIFVILLILGFGLRMGWGIARYRGALAVSGPAFLDVWDHDGLEHVLIAKALLSGKGYTVDASPALKGKHLRYVGEEALFKAPLYQFFLAGVFAISGFSFLLFFPLQSLAGGVLSGLVGLIAFEIFERPRTAWLAGLAAAAHPVLVNTASAPYNENIFFLLLVVSVWFLLLWLKSVRIVHAALCGAAIGLCVLTRESGLPLLAVVAAVAIANVRVRRKWVGCGAIALTAAATVVPWSVRNYARFGVVVPVSAMIGTNLAAGNNDCVGSESMFTPYSAERACAVLNQKVASVDTSALSSRVPLAVRNDRAHTRVAVEFIREHPGAYAGLAFRRLWTTLLPYAPRGNQRPFNRIAFTLYWLAVFPAGAAGLILALRRMEPLSILVPGLLLVLNLLSIVAVLYWSDLRFRVGADLLLGCFAAYAYAIAGEAAPAVGAQGRAAALESK